MLTELLNEEYENIDCHKQENFATLKQMSNMREKLSSDEKTSIPSQHGHTSQYHLNMDTLLGGLCTFVYQLKNTIFKYTFDIKQISYIKYPYTLYQTQR